MSAALLAHFDLLAGSAGGVAKLRELILSLAVRGRLVPQNPGDEPASELLKRIRAEKDRLIAEGKIKRDKPLAEIGENEKPFDLPGTWAWVRFGDASINRDGERIPVSSADRERRAKTYDYYGASGVIDRIDGYLFDKTLLLIGEDGANLINRSTPIAFLAHGKYWVNNHAHVIDTTHSNLMSYLCLFINAISLEPYVTGTAQPKMNQAKLNSIVVALPPLAEQSRIVAKVEELMALCDRLEAGQGHAARVQGHWVEAALDQLAESADADEFRRHWQHLAAHFDTLFTTPESIDRLDATLLQLAVRGKLVPQRLEDADASSYLTQPTALDYAGLHTLPTRWTWARVDEAGKVDLGRQRAPKHHHGPNMRPYLRVQNVYEARIDISDVKEMNFTPDEFKTFALAPGDVLLNEGQSRELVGRPAIYRGEVPDACFQNTLVRFRHYDFVIPDYALTVFRSYLHSGRFQQISKQTTNIAHLSAGRFAAMEFPLPPKNEQSRIVAQVEKLQALTAALKTRLAAAQSKQAHLRDALIAEVC